MATILIKLCIDNDRKDLIPTAAVAGIFFDVLIIIFISRLLGIGK